MLSLYKEMLREAGKIADYNYRYISTVLAPIIKIKNGNDSRHIIVFRNYAQRRIKERFRETATGGGETAVDKMATARQNLELIKRQAIVGNLFGSGETLAHEGRGGSKAS